MDEPASKPSSDLPVTIPGGQVLEGGGPIVIVGPNGSGKTRLSRQIATNPAPREFVNAQRSTRISQQLPVMSKLQASQNHQGMRDQAASIPWEIVSDFDFVLAQLLAEDGDAAREFRAHIKGGAQMDLNSMTALESVQAVWQEVFEGRSLDWNDWSPVVANDASVNPSYGANQMSDGERAALYLAAKVMLTPAGAVLIVDEPETHFHSLLAIRLWDALEAYRFDLRFIYVTHDLSFALSRKSATRLIAGPNGLRSADLDGNLPSEVSSEILGAASFSYYARRTVFCEGTRGSYDEVFLKAWFNGRDTAVFAVQSCEMVRQCAAVLANGAFLSNVSVLGVIDRDFRPDVFFSRLESYMAVLPVHEIEGLICVPAIWRVLARHLGKDGADLGPVIQSMLTEDLLTRTAHERWKLLARNRVEDAVSSKPDGFSHAAIGRHVANLESKVVPMVDLANLFREEVERVRSVVEGGDVDDILKMFPSKAIAGRAAATLGSSVNDLFNLIVKALGVTDDLHPLRGLQGRLEEALQEIGLPPRLAA